MCRWNTETSPFINWCKTTKTLTHDIHCRYLCEMPDCSKVGAHHTYIHTHIQQTSNHRQSASCHNTVSTAIHNRTTQPPATWVSGDHKPSNTRTCTYQEATVVRSREVVPHQCPSRTAFSLEALLHDINARRQGSQVIKNSYITKVVGLGSASDWLHILSPWHRWRYREIDWNKRSSEMLKHYSLLRHSKIHKTGTIREKRDKEILAACGSEFKASEHDRDCNLLSG